MMTIGFVPAAATVLSGRSVLSALSVLACLTTSSASAQTSVQLYGLVDAYAARVRSSTPTSSSSAFRLDSGGMTTSQFGLRIREDLGGSLKAFAALEAFFRGDIGEVGRFNGDVFFARNAFVGLQGEFGAVKLGRSTTPYFSSTVAFNPFGDSFVFSPAVAHTYRNGYVLNDSGWGNGVQFNSPVVGGLNMNLHWTAGLERDVEPNRTAGRGFGGNLNYGAGPLAVSFAAQKVDAGAATSTALTRQTALMLGASYDLKAVKLFGQIQHLKNELPSVASRTRMLQLGASAPIGPGRVLASAARSTVTDNDRLSADAIRTSFALGYDVYLSKRTDVYAAYFRSTLDVGGAESSSRVVGTGLRHRF